MRREGGYMVLYLFAQLFVSITPGLRLQHSDCLAVWPPGYASSRQALLFVVKKTSCPISMPSFVFGEGFFAQQMEVERDFLVLLEASFK